MKINFYDTRLIDDGRVRLVKVRSVKYDIQEVKNPQDVVCMMRKIIRIDKLAEEHCYMIGLNSACEVLGIFFISKGTVTGSLIGARELYIRALFLGASMIVLIHNHPSGNIYASKTDIETTMKIKEAGKLIGIPLIDHIIIGGNKYFSFTENEQI